MDRKWKAKHLLQYIPDSPEWHPHLRGPGWQPHSLEPRRQWPHSWMYAYGDMYIFTLNNWLIQLWGWQVQNLQSIAAGKDKGKS